MYKPKDEPTPQFDALVAGRSYVLALRDHVLENGEGLVPQAVALAKAEQAKHPEFKGVFLGRDCVFTHVDNAFPVPPQTIFCRAYAENHDAADAALSTAEVEVTKLPDGPIKLTVPGAE